ncbi:Polygalacturonase inhibitor [Morus notabilis]|uniref:Polygalacturonase inhibitor n=1 Tax=Morus notabilis TaxID=981085 RepID=W9S7V7_9ROSA|nr:polygalacturonase inhibitor [Morus notabilis]EXC30890.1 Polygalacturonase inhibitor [Morus notabilis]
MDTRPFLIFTLLFSTINIHSSHSELCHPQDKKVLLQIKQAFNNPYVLTSWDPQSDCCKWYFLKCDGTTHRINSLTISGGLSGEIPPQIGDLPYLQTLVLIKHENLRGPIPPTLTKLKNLTYLTISWTNVSGPVPQFLSQLKTLLSLDLSFNSLAGPVPHSLSQLPNLNSLHLERNKLTGPIPDSFGEFRGDDFYLYLSHNQLSGKIPASLGKKDFAAVDLSRNELEGDASFLFGTRKTTRGVDLSRNYLEFDLWKVEFPRSLRWLDLNHNKITGSIPVGLTELKLQKLNVSYNRLCGKIPVGGELQRFGYSAYFENWCLCGAPLVKSC